jgi:protocatechuate 3,4-dioxygenase beta subunit
MGPNANVPHRLSRREMLSFMAAAGAVVVVGCGDDDDTSTGATATTAGSDTPAATAASATPTPEPSALSCVVSPEMTEGPYFVDEMLDRADIRTDPSDGSTSEGVPLVLGINVYQVDGDACSPIEGAHVDVWHCDAGGLYSDVSANNTVGQKFLRGYQLTDANGGVQFTTIYPGWYMGRAVHIHFKVRTDPASETGYEFTSQVFFDEELTNEIYAEAPYSDRGLPDTSNGNDMIYAGGGDQMILAAAPEGDGYRGTIDVGVQFG